MKKIYVVLACLLVLDIAAHFVPVVHAQTSGVPFSFSTAGTHTSCAVVSGETQYCFAGDGMWISLSGAAYSQVGAANVQSFNGRTGTVVPVAGDYTYSQLASPPTTISCPTASLASGSTGVFTATGCTIK